MMMMMMMMISHVHAPELQMRSYELAEVFKVTAADGQLSLLPFRGSSRQSHIHVT